MTEQTFLNMKILGHTEATRHLCEEASGLLSSLRSGPPAVARGDLVENLRVLRLHFKKQHLSLASSPSPEPAPTLKADDDDDNDNEEDNDNKNSDNSINDDETNSIRGDDDDLVHLELVQPFLAVITDPSASGRHTLTALRAVHRLLERGSLVSLVRFEACHKLSLDVIARGVLACVFEQTDVAGDEAVEMALADLLGFVVVLDSAKLRSIPIGGNKDDFNLSSKYNNYDFILPLQSQTRMEAFTTVFVARNTFIHSPALCYHVEGVLQNMITATFRDSISPHRTSAIEDAARTMLEFLTQQLLHTPLNIGGLNNKPINVNVDAQALHDATRILCLRLVRCIVREGWSNDESTTFGSEGDENCARLSSLNDYEKSRSLISIIKDELCLSLLIIGQTAGTYSLSLEVLSEVCRTIMSLWGSSAALRQNLFDQFEAIISGFFVRTLAQLRQRYPPKDAEEEIHFQSFDDECEIILETLVDMMCLVDESNISTIEILFFAYVSKFLLSQTIFPVPDINIYLNYVLLFRRLGL